jgi:hypothetical protein
VTSLNKFKRLVGSRQQKVGKKAERIILFADAMEKRQEKILAVPAISPFPNYVMFDLEGMPPQCDELDRIYLWGMQVYGDKPNGQPRYRRSKIQSCALKTSGMIVPQFGTCHYAQLKDANETAL